MNFEEIHGHQHRWKPTKELSIVRQDVLALTLQKR